MGASGVREAVTSSTVAVVAVGFLGIPERLELLSEICHENSLVLIEDSAQCFPPESYRKPLADFVVLSFGRGKPINLMGGGALLVRNEMFTDCADILGTYSVRQLKINFWWFAKRAVFNALMSRISYFFLERLPFLGIGETRFHPLDSISRLEMPAPLFQAGVRSFWSRPPVQPHYHAKLEQLEAAGWILPEEKEAGVPGNNDQHRLLRFPVLAPDREMRDRALTALNSAGIGASVFYGAALSEIDGLEIFLEHRDCPFAKDFSCRLLTLPAHEDVTISDIELVAEVLFSLIDN
jgi:dTDP-4-amino-4,6-dideoxygalactose transaminase